MYKKKKVWVVAPILFLGVIGLSGMTANAAESDISTSKEDVQTSQVSVDRQMGELQGEPTLVNESATSVSEEGISGVKKQVNEEKNGTTETSENVSEFINEEKEPSSETQEQLIKENGSDSLENKEEQTLVDPETNGQQNEQTSESSTKEEPKDADIEEQNESEQEQNVEVEADLFSGKQEQVEESNAMTRAEQQVPIYRVYNPNSGEHLHTMNWHEKENLVRHGWRYEGVSMKVGSSGRELYRAYNPNTGEHLWTLNWNEIKNVTRHGWRYEGVAWRTPWSGLPMYRVFNPNARNAGSHHYTLLQSERDNLKRRGWRDEGVAWYALGGADTVSSYALLNVPYINQNAAGFPMGCEAASLLQALQHKGYAKNHNLKSFIKEMPRSADNNPNNGFSGKPDHVVSGIYHSIYAKPLAKWGNRYGKVSDISGSSVETLKNELRNGHPVVVYITLNFASPQYGSYWWGKGINNAHIVTLDGFNQANNSYHISDPNGGKYWVSGNKFEASYNLRHSAVVIR